MSFIVPPRLKPPRGAFSQCWGSEEERGGPGCDILNGARVGSRYRMVLRAGVAVLHACGKSLTVFNGLTDELGSERRLPDDGRHLTLRRFVCSHTQTHSHTHKHTDVLS